MTLAINWNSTYYLVATFIQILDPLDEMAIMTTTIRHYKVRNKELQNYQYFMQIPGVS